MGKASKIVAPNWLADSLLSAMSPNGRKDASYDFLNAVETSISKSPSPKLDLDNE